MSRRKYKLIHGDCLKELSTLPDASVDAVITDPPYSSGGMFRGDRAQSTTSKYVQTEVVKRGLTNHAAFSGDNRDQRSWLRWCSLWLEECRRVTKPTGYLCVFTDWRQLPTTTDAIQIAGWIWRGIVAWNKGLGARSPHTGYFRHQCEHVVWGTNGASAQAPGRGPFPGCFSYTIKQTDKHHQAGKPTPLLCDLAQCVPIEGVVLDPFMGSGTTGVACQKTGRRFIGMELDVGYFDIAKKRIAAA